MWAWALISDTYGWQPPEVQGVRGAQTPRMREVCQAAALMETDRFRNGPCTPATYATPPTYTTPQYCLKTQRVISTAANHPQGKIFWFSGCYLS